MTNNKISTNRYVFLIVWLGQFISIVGSGLTGFALGVTVFQETGRATDFILIEAFIVIPSILLAPIAGNIIDRYNRRTVMLASDLIAGISTLFVITLISINQLDIWHIYLVTAINASANTFQYPAYSALIAQVVPNSYLPRANGFVTLSVSVSAVGAPVIAGFLVATLGIEAVLLMDVISFVFAVTTLLLVRVPDVYDKNHASNQTNTSILGGLKIGWTFVRERPGLFAFLIFAILLNIIAIPELLVTPLVLSFATEENLGLVLGMGGIGYLLGSIIVSVWGGPKRLIIAAIGVEAITGLATISLGLRPSVEFVSIALFIQHLTFAISMPAVNTIWQRKVPKALHGRVFSLRRVIGWMALPVTLWLAGPLVDNILEPFMQSDHPLAYQIGTVIGNGDGRGIALMMLISGSLNTLLAIGALLYRPLRDIETSLPDED